MTVWDVNKEALDALKSDAPRGSGTLYCHYCDITDEEDVKAGARRAFNEMGRVDILINNAGTVTAGRFCSHVPEAWEQLTQVNLIAMYYTIYAFLPAMRERGTGHIVNISSGAGLVGMPDLAVYCATKWAVYGLTESLRLEALADGLRKVRFSSVHPGILRKGLFEGSKMNLMGEIMIPRVKSHDAIARVVVNRALKRGRSVVMKPWSLHIGPFIRGFLPDRVLNRLMLLAGSGHSMDGWVGNRVRRE